MGLGFFLHRSASGRTWVGHDGGMPGHSTALLTHRESGTGGIALMNSTSSPDPDRPRDRAGRPRGRRRPGRRRAVAAGTSVPEELAGILGRWFTEGRGFTFSVREGRLEARMDGAPATRAPSVFEAESPRPLPHGLRPRARGAPPRDPRTDDGRVDRLHWATYLCTREPLGFGEHLRRRTSGVDDLDPHGLRVEDRLVQHGPAAGPAPRATAPPPSAARSRGSASTSSTAAWSPPVTSGTRSPGSAPRGRRRPRRPAAPGCRAAGRTAAGSGPRPWCGPGRAAGRSCARPSGRPPIRAIANPPLRTSSTPHVAGAARPRRRPTASPAPRTPRRTAAGPRTSSRPRPCPTARRRGRRTSSRRGAREVLHPAHHARGGYRHGDDLHGVCSTGRRRSPGGRRRRRACEDGPHAGR